MNANEYWAENSRLWAVLEARNEVVDNFTKANPDLMVPGVYEQFWELQNEATKAVGAIQEFQANNRPR